MHCQKKKYNPFISVNFYMNFQVLNLRFICKHKWKTIDLKTASSHENKIVDLKVKNLYTNGSKWHA